MMIPRNRPRPPDESGFPCFPGGFPGVSRIRPAVLTLLCLAGLLSGACAPRNGGADFDFAAAIEQLSVVPAYADARPAAVSAMLSSYDRTGGNRDWADWRELRIGENDYLLADLRGPGCLRRIWMTNVRAGEWRFYFDNESRPRLRLTEDELFARDGRGSFPFEPPLADSISGGAFSYVPLPYRRRLRIVVRDPHTGPDARPYYHINYETFDGDLRVKTFPRRPGEHERAAVRRAREAWKAAEPAMRAVAQRLDWRDIVVAPGAKATVFEKAGAGLIETLGLRLNLPPGLDALDRARALRSLVLLAYWDGAAEPSVETPLGDFFCNGLHARRFSSLTLANIDGTYLCRFPMPFAKGARLLLRNDTDFPIAVAAATETGAARSAGAPRYFHSSWQQAVSPGRPFRIMRTAGRGLFMGAYLIALGMEDGWNILEGDEFFHRDGSLIPVHHGTGLEDYFNGGWYYYGLFEQPLHGLTEKAAMRTAQYRLQIPDPVTFESALEMRIEFGDGNRSRGYKSAAAYWYQDRPGPAGSAIPPLGERFPEVEPIGMAAAMSELFELERMGLDREAGERSAFYAALFEGQPAGELFGLRALAYREIREGSDAVRDAYRAVAKNPDAHPEAVRQAEMLAWRGDAPRRALFGGQAYSGFRLYVNGTPAGEGGDPFTYRAFPVELAPGRALLQAEIVTRGEHSFYSLGFLSDFTNVVSDITWDYSVVRPDGWPEETGPDNLWKPYAVSPSFFPNMQWWRFTPNAFPAVQSGRQVGGPFPEWQNPAGRTIYLRRRIHVPGDGHARINPFTRRYAFRSVAVRPADDASNQ